MQQFAADDAIAHPNCIYNIALDLTSSNIQARKLILDNMTFLAHWDFPRGHMHVLKGLDNLMNVKGDVARFDAWFTVLENTLDGRGKMGSLVGASEEIRTLRGREAQMAMQAANESMGFSSGDNALNEYAVSWSSWSCAL